MRGRNKFRVVQGGRRWTKPQDYQTRNGGWWRYSGLWLGAVFVGLMVGIGPSWLSEIGSSGNREPKALLGSAKGVRASFGSCHIGGGYNCVVDGDTLYVEGVKIRVADIDAPETHDPRCASERELGDRATDRLRQLVNSGTVTLASIDRDEDRYGRKLRIVKVDGDSVGDTLVGEGLARWYGNGRRPWC
jgi:endonuclease YncB( thermonuclease family)